MSIVTEQAGQSNLLMRNKRRLSAIPARLLVACLLRHDEEAPRPRRTLGGVRAREVATTMTT
jgi:hypothetical protein